MAREFLLSLKEKNMEPISWLEFGSVISLIVLFMIVFDTVTGRFGAPDADRQPNDIWPPV